MKNFFAILCVFAAVSLSAGEITDSTTGVSFPSEVSFSYNGKNYDLKATGVSTRKKFIVKVYSVASYLQKDATVSSDKFASIMDDNAAKQLTLKWVRDVDAARVMDGFRDSLNQSFAKGELSKVQSDIDRFIDFFNKDVSEGEEQVLRWIPGGTIEVVINGSSVGTIQNPTFAKGLWKIWFGDKSVVNRKGLVSQI